MQRIRRLNNNELLRTYLCMKVENSVNNKMKWKCPEGSKGFQSHPTEEGLAGMAATSIDDDVLKLKNLVGNESRFWNI